MLQITIPAQERYNESTNRFYDLPEQRLSLEHSLISISKWESKWKKPFLGNKKKTNEETIDYIRCMTLTQNVPPEIYYNLPDDVIHQIHDYIDSPMTATWFSDKTNTPSREVITSEVVYYWMITFGIPFECQKWHFNRLITLIRVCNEKNKPSKKMSKKELMDRNRSLNAARRKSLHSKG